MSPLILKIILAAVLMLLWTYRVEILGMLGGMLPAVESPSDGVSGPPVANPVNPNNPAEIPVTDTNTTISMRQLLQISEEKPDLFMDLLPLALPKEVREAYEQNK